VFALALLTATALAHAEIAAVPVKLQAALTSRLIEYLQDPSVRELGTVRVGILAKSSNTDSVRAAAEFKGELSRFDTIAGLPHSEASLEWTSAANLVEESRRGDLRIIYLAPGLDSELSSIVAALDGKQIVTIAGDPLYVKNGVILGFDLVEARPKMVFNERQATKQNVKFKSQVMKLMRLVE
jgi:hypothetical protein